MWSLLPVLLLFLLGYLLQKARFLTAASLIGIRKLVSTLALPALIFQAFSSLEMERRYVLLVAIIFLVGVLMVLIGRLVAKPLHMVSPYFPLLMGGFEMGMLGYALFLSAYGEEHLGKMALIDLGQVVFVFFVLMALLLRLRDGARDTKVLIRQFATSPVILAICAGMVVSLVGDRVPEGSFTNSLGEALGSFITLLAHLTVPLIAITIGYGIHIGRAGLMESLKTIAIRKILLMGLALAINHFVVEGVLHLPRIYCQAVLVMFLTPPPFIISIYLRPDNQADADYVANTLSLDTLVSIIMVMVVSVVYP